MYTNKSVLDDAVGSVRRTIMQSLIGSTFLLTAGSAVAAFGMPDRFSFNFPVKTLPLVMSDAALYPERNIRSKGADVQTASVTVPIAAAKIVAPEIVAAKVVAPKVESKIVAVKPAVSKTVARIVAEPPAEAAPIRIMLASADLDFALPASIIEASAAPLMVPVMLTPELAFDPTPDPRAVGLTLASLPSAASIGPTVEAARAAEAKPAEIKPLTPAEQLGLTGKDRVKAERCLAQAIYFEARNEPARGQIAVAQVVMNRVFSPYYPKDVCSVVYQNAHRLLSCQFTFACDGQPEAIRERGAWSRAQRIAKQTLDAKVWLKDVAKSTHYHASYVRPAWIRDMRKMARYGLHTFYRPHLWGDGSREAGWVTLAEVKKKSP